MISTTGYQNKWLKSLSKDGGCATFKRKVAQPLIPCQAHTKNRIYFRIRVNRITEQDKKQYLLAQLMPQKMATMLMRQIDINIS